jgi:two-component system sensor histidine kinase UhpB
VTLQRRFGGPAAFSLTVWIVVCATSLLALALASDVDLSTTNGRIRGGLAFLAGVILTGAVFLLIRRLRPAGRDLRLRTTVLLTVGVALVRTAAFIPIANPGGVDTGFATGSQVVASTIATMLTILVMNAVMESVSTHRRLRAELTATLVDLRHQQLQQDALGEAIDHALLAEVLTATDSARQQTDATTPVHTPGDRLAIADALRATAVGPLRSLSHRLDATEGTTPLAETRFLRVLISTVRTHPLWPRETAAVSALVAGTSVIYLRREEASTGGVLTTLLLVLGSIAIQFGAVWLSLAAITACGRRLSAIAAMAIPLAVIATAATSLGRSDLFDAYTAASISGRSVSLVVIVSVLVVVLVNAAMASQVSQETIIERLHVTIDAAETEAQARNRELVRASRTLARYVHGTLQSRLLASALAIEQAERTGDPAGFDRALEQAREALLLPEALPTPTTDLALALRDSMGLWSGLATIDMDLPESLPLLSSALITKICLIVEEGVANAMRHGAATAIGVALTAADRRITITITDDGVGPTGGAAGLGSTVFDRAGSSPWQLAPRPDARGSVLSVVVDAAGPYAPMR